MHRPIRVIVTAPAILALLLPIASAAPTATTKPVATKPAVAPAKAADAAIMAAVKVLVREDETYLKDGKSPVRSSSDYFTQKPSPDVTPDAIAVALGRTYSQNPRVDAYVKWQLLSAVPGKFQGSQLGPAITAYRLAPEPLLMPGMEGHERAELERLRGTSISAEAVAQLDVKIKDQIEKTTTANAPILGYRDALFAKLPPTYDALNAGFEDAYERLKAGAETKDLVESLSSVSRLWLTSTPPPTPQQLDALGKTVTTLSREQGPQYFAGIEWNEEKRKSYWQTRRPHFYPAKPLEDLAKEFVERSHEPASKAPPPSKTDDKAKEKDKQRDTSSRKDD